ncbi:MAG: tectonin domain-containing protein [Terriglobales bacterium]
MKSVMRVARSRSRVARFNTDTGFFDMVGPATKTQVAVGTAEVWSINSSSQIDMYDTAAEEWIQVDPSAALTEIAAGSNGNIWGLNSGEVYLYSTKKPKQFNLVEPQPPEPSAILRVSSAGTGVFVLAPCGLVYKY